MEPLCDGLALNIRQTNVENTWSSLSSSLLISTEYLLHVFWREKRRHGYGLSKEPEEPIRLFLISM